MLKLLTLNAHTWLEENALQKLSDLADRIVQEDYDIICLQEVNQKIGAPPVSDISGYIKLPKAPVLNESHFVCHLLEELSVKGVHYYWSWAYNHIGYDKYEEGVAILSKTSFQADEVLVSGVDDVTTIETRRVLVARTKLKGRVVTIVSLHLSWFDKGFEQEWRKLESALKEFPKPLILMGDFNNPTDTVGYNMVVNSLLDLKDSHKTADRVAGDYTIVSSIDGWESNCYSLKVDHVFLSKEFDVVSSCVVFDGIDTPIVSDHFGVEVEISD